MDCCFIYFWRHLKSWIVPGSKIPGQTLVLVHTNLHKLDSLGLLKWVIYNKLSSRIVHFPHLLFLLSAPKLQGNGDEADKEIPTMPPDALYCYIQLPVADLPFGANAWITQWVPLAHRNIADASWYMIHIFAVHLSWWNVVYGSRGNLWNHISSFNMTVKVCTRFLQI